MPYRKAIRRPAHASAHDDTMWGADLAAKQITVIDEEPEVYFTGLYDDTGNEIWYYPDKAPMGYHKHGGEI